MSTIDKLKDDADRFGELADVLESQLREAVYYATHALEILDQLIDTLPDVEPARLEAYYKAARITDPQAFAQQIGWRREPESAAYFVEEFVALADQERQRFDRRERRARRGRAGQGETRQA